MRRDERSAVIFTPSPYSYGADEELSHEEMGQQAAAYIPALKAALGIDDARARAARYESRLRTLRKGDAAAQLMAIQVCGLCSIQTAIQRTEALLADANAEATQLRTRNALYTALTVTGVLAGMAVTAWIASKAYQEYLETQD